MMMAIQLMGYLLQTAHRDSVHTYGGRREKEDPFQGLCQVNGVGPSGWVGMSSMILRHQRAQGHGVKVTNCLSLSLLILVYLLYVDDGELFEASHSGKEFSERVAERLQVLVKFYIG